MIFEKQILKFYKNKIFTRCDNPLGIFYFSKDDYLNLTQEPFAFKSSKGHTLQGYFYHYPNYDKKRIIIFEHGFGNGHRAYMTEIEKLCNQGYRVFTYNHTGCMESGGESTNGFAQSLVDLNDAINALKQNPQTKMTSFSVIGHSWGAYSTLNIVALHPNINHIVAISGYLSVKKIISQIFSGVLKIYQNKIIDCEIKANKDFFNYDAVTSLKKYDGKALVIYSDNDNIVKPSFSYDILQKELGKKSNISLLLEHNKFHNPNYTQEAVTYLNNFSKELTNAAKAKKLNTPETQKKFMQQWDWNKMTEQDDNLWNKIYEHLL